MELQQEVPTWGGVAGELLLHPTAVFQAGAHALCSTQAEDQAGFGWYLVIMPGNC